MPLCSCFDSFLYKMDALSTISMFKYNGLPSYRTKTGGVLTLMFIIFLIILFALRLSSRKKGELMTYTQKQVLSHDLLNVTTASNSTNQFMIALNLYDT